MGGTQRHLLHCSVDLPVPFLALCLSCTVPGAPTLAVGVVPLHTGGGYPTASSVLLWGFCCTEWVSGSSDMSLLRERSCFDPRESGVMWPSAQAGLHCGVSLPWRRHCIRFRRKGEICRPSTHTKPAVLNLLRPRFLDSTASGKSADPLFRPTGRAVALLVGQTLPLVPFIKYSLFSGLSLLRTDTRHCADNLSSELWRLAVSAYTLLQTCCCLTPCICFSEPDPHRETGPATPTREWVHGEIPRTSWCLRMLSILIAPPPPLRSALPDGRARTLSCCQLITQ